MTATKELKPCPFCGKEEDVELLYYDCTYAIWCNSCMCGTTYFDSEEEANNIWNTRQYTTDKCKEQREIDRENLIERFIEEGYTINQNDSHETAIVSVYFNNAPEPE